MLRGDIVVRQDHAKGVLDGNGDGDCLGQRVAMGELENLREAVPHQLVHSCPQGSPARHRRARDGVGGCQVAAGIRQDLQGTRVGGLIGLLGYVPGQSGNTAEVLGDGL